MNQGPMQSGDFLTLEVLRSLEIGIIVFDTQREKIIFINDMAAEVFKPLKDYDYHTIFPMLFSEIGDIPKKKSKQYILNFNERVFGYTVYPLQEKYLWINLSDITEKIRLQKIAEAMTLMNNIGFIFSGLAHELGNPINTIKMSMTVLKKNLATFPPETVNEYVDNVISEIGRMEYLLKTMKSFNAYEELQIQDVDFHEFFQNFLRLIKRDVEKKGIRLEIQFEVKSPVAKADPRGLQQVLLNLLTNSIDALEGRESPAISITVLQVADRIYVKFRDNGRGIPKEELKNIFLPFYTSKAKGTGLGMVIVKKLLTGMGGTIEIASVEDEETTTTISLAESSRALFQSPVTPQ